MNIKKRTIQTTIAIIGGDGISSIIRLAGNLVLTRLLVPEFFGLMAIVNVLLMGVGLFSDLGIGPALIRKKNGFEPEYMNTAWTVQVIRGFALWFVTLAVCYPAYIFYDEPMLLKILPVVGFVFVISGFNSMALAKLNKELRMFKIVVMKITSQIIGLFLMISFAYLYRNVWSLVIGNLFGVLIKAIWSNYLDNSIKHRFFIDKKAFHDILNFGKWIFISTAMMFLANQADRLILGKIFSLTLLGMYSIAAGFAELPKSVINKLSSGIIFPLISIFSYLPIHQLRKSILEKRKVLLYPAAILISILSGFGDILIDILYDARYKEAGWILPLLSLGMWPFLLYGTIDKCLFVMDSPKYTALGNFLKFIYMVTFLPFANYFGGKLWVIIVIALNDLPAYITINYGLKKMGLSCIIQDILSTLFLIANILLILLIRSHFELGITGIANFESVAINFH